MKKIYSLLALCLFITGNAQIINFPDPKFKEKLIEEGTPYPFAQDLNGNYFKIDSNNDGEIEVSEALQVSWLNVSFSGLSSIEGISNFTNLKYLDCSGCGFCFDTEPNIIHSIDVSSLINLEYFDFSGCLTSSLNINNLTKIKSFKCGNNGIQSLDLSNFTQLENFDSTLNHNLIYLNLKNGTNEIVLNFYGNTSLKYICADDSQLTQIQNKIVSYGLTNCSVSSYCSFVPGGTYYTIQGNNKLDIDNNGCDASDINFPNLKLTFSDGINNGSYIGDSTGSYNLEVLSGTNTITPVIENPTYFSVSPTNVTVSFPTQSSPFTQDFCINATGVHPDLEIILLPLNTARPGFDALYKIIYKNKGNQTQSGIVNLTFEDAVLYFVSANPTTSNQTTNNLTWNFTNLAPFETREITLTLNLNSPTETPAVNIGDQLNFTAVVNPLPGDETPNDNTIAFNQIVGGSYDPNDKTCIEGTTITPEMVGEYVHYVIRFENTGTFPAENIVVKDLIDTAKFDINSLIPIKGSHEFVTKISDTNKVEFIFENINLPFDDANNDGFVAFKIKTKSSLILGDTFSNSANIYFDYNFPILTNTVTTTVQTLGKSDFEFSKYFTVYPNPASTNLNLSVKNGVIVNSIGIYNTLGQLVIAIPNAQTISNIDVSSLKTGNYFIKMNTDKGTSNTKFIKN